MEEGVEWNLLLLLIKVIMLSTEAAGSLLVFSVEMVCMGRDGCLSGCCLLAPTYLLRLE